MLLQPVHSSRSYLTRRMHELQHKANVVPYCKSHPASFSQSQAPSSMMREASLKAPRAATEPQITVYLDNQLINKKIQAIQQSR